MGCTALWTWSRKGYPGTLHAKPNPTSYELISKLIRFESVSMNAASIDHRSQPCKLVPHQFLCAPRWFPPRTTASIFAAMGSVATSLLHASSSTWRSLEVSIPFNQERTACPADTARVFWLCVARLAAVRC